MTTKAQSLLTLEEAKRDARLTYPPLVAKSLTLADLAPLVLRSPEAIAASAAEGLDDCPEFRERSLLTPTALQNFRATEALLRKQP